ncbi:YbaB/EbfC family nucleoid-associated protein [Dactylosporangium sp. CA-092794]|uniref:YbaB/EbfC family nucleoid-associated protein n=1 Tax=Dactylosporangium sp. CA-092794 TaxID=3239929 RepID=UPI003D8C63E5
MQPGTNRTDNPDNGLDDLMRMAQSVRDNLVAAQASMAETEVTGAAPGVAITMTALGEFRSVSIDPALADPQAIEVLEGRVLGALRDAAAGIRALAEDRFGAMQEGLYS